MSDRSTTRPWILALGAFVLATWGAGFFMFRPAPVSAFLASVPDLSGAALIASALGFAVAAVVEYDR